MDEPQARDLLRTMFEAAVAAADPALVVPPVLPTPPAGRTLVLGAGKAAAAMARAVETAWPAADLSGLVVTGYGYEVPCERIEVVAAAHPVPDAAGRAAAGRILEAAQGLGPDDLMLALVSGGASALLTLPAPGLTLEDKQAVNRLLLRSGAHIGEMNCVRKHLSGIKGGRLAQAAAPARAVTILISDVPGDDAATIGSGPTVADPTTFANARAIITKYGIDLPQAVARHLAAAAEETPNAGDALFAGHRVHFAGLPSKSLAAAAEIAGAAGLVVHDLGDRVEGEAREVGAEHARLALACQQGTGPVAPPCVILSGGETTVTLKGNGGGGPNTDYLMGLACELSAAAGIYALAGDTDGIDGSEDNAGAFVTPDTLVRAAEAGLDPAALMADNDPYRFFSGLDDLLMTGPTYTNVNDLRAVLVTR